MKIMTLRRLLCVLGGMVTMQHLEALPVRFIHPAAIASAVFTISTPGLYVLTDDVAYNTAGGDAITISSHDVVLDLNGKSIINGGSGTEDGIVITGTNITIKNGTLRNFDGDSIRVSAGYSNLVFKDLSFSASLAVPASASAFNFAGTSGSAVRTLDVLIDNCHVTQLGKGLNAVATDKVRLLNSTFNSNTSGRGVSIQDCNIWEVDHCQVSNNSSTLASEGLGFAANLCTCFRIRNSEFNGNVAAAGGQATGCIFQEGGLNAAISGDILVENCSFCSNSSPVSSGIVGLASGLEFQSTDSIVVRNCIFNGNNAIANSAFGLRLATASIAGALIQDCVALGNTTTSIGASKDAFGFSITGSGNSVINCYAAGNTSVNGVGIGFNIAGNSERCFVKNCTSVSNSHQGFNFGSATQSLFIGNKSFRNGGSAAGNYVGTVPFFPAIPAGGPYPLAGTFDERELANLSFS